MTLPCAFYGAAFKDAEVKESKSGNHYLTALIAVSNGTDDEGHDQHLFVKVIAFGEFAPELGKLKRNDRAYCEGTLDVRVWTSDKEPRPDLNLKAYFVRRTAIGKDKPKRESQGEPSCAGPPSHRNRIDAIARTSSAHTTSTMGCQSNLPETV